MKRFIVLILFMLSALPAFAQPTITENITSNGDCVTLMMSSATYISTIQVANTFTATIAFTATANGVTWASITGYPSPAGTAVSSTTATGLWQFNTGGMIGIRACATAYTSGGAVVTINGSGTGLVDTGNWFALAADEVAVGTGTGLAGYSNFTFDSSTNSISIGTTSTASDGNLQIGALGSVTWGFTPSLYVEALVTNTALDPNPVLIYGNFNPSSDSQTVDGLIFAELDVDGTKHTTRATVNEAILGNIMDAGGIADVLEGYSANIGFFSGAGTVASQRGISIDMRSKGTTTVTESIGVYVKTPTKDGGATLTTSYGIKLDNQNIGGTTYAIYTGSGTTRLGGSLAVGGDLPTGYTFYNNSGTSGMAGRVYVPGVSTSAAAQTNYLCSASTGEIIAVAVAANCATSSGRFKHDVSYTDVAGLDTVLQLKPVSFVYNNEGFKPELSDWSTHYGFIAEDVAKVDERLVSYDYETGLIRGVQYEMYTAVLTKAIQELSEKVARLEAKLQ